jgi:peptidoglycan/xylan/chitin deacetylase (PgdA/CDA1 family)
MAKTIVLALLVAAAVTPAAGGTADRAVPILEFHVVGRLPAGEPFPQLYDPPATFKAQLAWLGRHGYRTVTLDRLLRAWEGTATLPQKPVVLTFDDGYPQDVSLVRPLLRARGWRAVLNLQVGNLAPDKVRRLIAAGWEIDAHTFTHPDLTKVSPRQLRHEVAGSRTWISGVFGVPVDFFCYPDGRFDAAVVEAVKRAGYLGAESEQPGLASPANGLYRLDRIEILRSDGVAGLAARIG